MTICYFGAYDKTYSKDKINLDGLKKIGVTVVECSIKKPPVKFTSKIYFAFFTILHPLTLPFRNLYGLVKGICLFIATPYDVILVGHPGHFDVPAAYVLAKILRKPLIFDAVLSLYDVFVNEKKLIRKDSMKGKLLFVAEKIIYSLCDVILVISKQEKVFFENLFALPPSKVDISYLGADDGMYYKRKESNFDTQGKFIVAFYGFHAPLHGISHIMRSAKICEKDPSIQYFFIGAAGQTYKSDVSLSQELGLGNVSFLDLNEKTGAIDVLSKADIVLGVFENMPTGQRAIPNKIFQGLAMGKPVITAKSDGVLELFTHGENIYLCDSANPESLANAILMLKNNKQLRNSIAEKGYEMYKEKFTCEAVARDLVRICEKVTQQKHEK